MMVKYLFCSFLLLSILRLSFGQSVPLTNINSFSITLTEKYGSKKCIKLKNFKLYLEYKDTLLLLPQVNKLKFLNPFQIYNLDSMGDMARLLVCSRRKNFYFDIDSFMLRLNDDAFELAVFRTGNFKYIGFNYSKGAFARSNIAELLKKPAPAP